MAKHRICLICPKAYSLFTSKGDIQFGGAEVQLYTLAITLAEDELCRVKAVVVDAGQPLRVQVNRVDLVRSYALTDSLAMRMLRMAAALMRTAGDVYVQRSMTPFTAVLAVLSRVAGKPFLYMIAADREITVTRTPFSILRRLAFRIASLCVYQNSYQKHMLTKLNVSHKAYLPSSTPYDIPKSLPRFTDRKYVLWVGRLTPIKQPEFLLEVARRLPHVVFIALGSRATGQEAYGARVISDAESLPNLQFRRGVSLFETQAYFEGSVLLLNTSSSEGMPATFVQAWAAGTPVVSLGVNPSDLLTNQRLGFACDYSIDRAVETIEKLWVGKSDFDKVSQACHEYARAHHDRHTNARRFMELIQRKGGKV